MVTAGELVDRYGINHSDVFRWVQHGLIRPSEGGGIGNPYTFDDLDDLDEAVVRVLVEWRRATKRRAVTRVIGAVARQQLGERLDCIVAVPLATNVIVTIGGEL
jgi:hypothetical protein